MTDEEWMVFGRPSIIDRLAGGLIVSCQALTGEPLYGSEIMARMALAAENAGAVGIRANSPEDIAAIRRTVKLPIIGLHKVEIPGFDPYITPTAAIAKEIARAGAEIVAFDATLRPHPEGDTDSFLRRVRSGSNVVLMADISTFEEGVAAAAAGADIVSTTMSGYTPYSPQQSEPDLELVRALARALTIPVVAEGRITTPEQAKAALAAGAFAVVVGGAITRPQQIARRFVEILARG